MQNHADAGAQIVQVPVLYVDAVHQHLPLIGIVQPGDQRDQRGLAGAGRADDADGGAGGNVQVDVIQHALGAVLVIAEGDVPQLHTAFPDRQLRVCGFGVGDVGDFLHDLPDAACGRHGAGHLDEQHTDHHQRVEHLRDVGDEGGQIAGGHTARHDLPAAEPQHRECRGVHAQRHERGHEDHEQPRGHSGFFQLRVGFFKAPDLVLLPDKGLDHADVGQVFLHIGVQPVHAVLHGGEAWRRHFDEDGDADCQNRHGNRQHQRHMRPLAYIHGNDHDQCADQHPGGAQSHTQERIDEVLQLGDVVGQPRDQRACAEAVDVAEGEALHLAVDIGAQVGGEVDRRLGAEVCAAHAADHHQDGGQDHGNGDCRDEGYVVGIGCHASAEVIQPADKGGGVFGFSADAVVDDVRQKPGHQHLTQHLDDHQNRSCDEIEQVWLDVLAPMQSVRDGCRLRFDLLAHGISSFPCSDFSAPAAFFSVAARRLSAIRRSVSVRAASSASLKPANAALSMASKMRWLSSTLRSPSSVMRTVLRRLSSSPMARVI